MALPVDVKSIDVLQAVREAFVLFSEDASHALGSMDMEIRHCLDWLTHDQRIYWQNEVKRRSEKLSEAKAELHRKQLSQMFGEHAHDSEQREGVREAKRRLEEAEDKVEQVQRWLPVVQRAVSEYNGQARPFADILEFEVENSIALLDRMINAIEEYTNIAPAQTSRAATTLTTSSTASIQPASTPVAASASEPPPEPAVAQDPPAIPEETS
jgi:hypothetical protein